ncbi:MAG TPA: hypothetical protein VGM88_00685 [Kofleriaceae bacterium]
MRNALFAAVLSLGSLVACNHTLPPTNNAGHANVAVVRHQIQDAISAEHSPRAIVSMGHVTPDAATVYTTAAPGAPSRAESWVRGANGWKLDHIADDGQQPVTSPRS